MWLWTFPSSSPRCKKETGVHGVGDTQQDDSLQVSSGSFLQISLWITVIVFKKEKELSEWPNIVTGVSLSSFKQISSQQPDAFFMPKATWIFCSVKSFNRWGKQHPLSLRAALGQGVKTAFQEHGCALKPSKGRKAAESGCPHSGFKTVH